MKGDIALVGFVLTADEWRSVDTDARTQLLSAAFRRPAIAREDAVTNPHIDSARATRSRLAQ